MVWCLESSRYDVAIDISNSSGYIISEQIPSVLQIQTHAGTELRRSPTDIYHCGFALLISQLSCHGILEMEGLDGSRAWVALRLSCYGQENAWLRFCGVLIAHLQHGMAVR
jgi:hypothetical protein